MEYLRLIIITALIFFMGYVAGREVNKEKLEDQAEMIEEFSGMLENAKERK